MSDTTDHITTATTTTTTDHATDHTDLISDYQALTGTTDEPHITTLDEIASAQAELDQIIQRNVDENMSRRNDYTEKSKIQSYECLEAVLRINMGNYRFVCDKIKEMKKILDVPEHIKSIYLDNIDYINEKCPICLDVLEDRTNIILSNCGHLFCKSCFSDLEKLHICRGPICMNPNMILDKKQWYKQKDDIVEQVRHEEPISQEELWNREYDEYGFVNSDHESDCMSDNDMEHEPIPS